MTICSHDKVLETFLLFDSLVYQENETEDTCDYSFQQAENHSFK